MSVRVQDNTPQVMANMQRRASVALRFAIDDIERISRPKTPKADTNFLRNNVKKQTLGTRGKISWNTAYAQYQERGMRRDGSRRVRNYTTGGTGKAFAFNAVKQVTKDMKKYFDRARI